MFLDRREQIFELTLQEANDRVHVLLRQKLLLLSCVDNYYCKKPHLKARQKLINLAFKFRRQETTHSMLRLHSVTVTIGIK